MPILRHFLVQAAAKLSKDPRVRAKVAEVVEKEVKPRATAAWRKTKPKLEAARDDLREIASETDPRDDPREFAAKVKQRFVDRGKDRQSK
ncbi:MAG: hypothetical protein GY791_09910 [Alphaproteobacteria bacterium]|nr:hypothetical protein [Alphaproteobacteria bacterium]